VIALVTGVYQSGLTSFNCGVGFKLSAVGKNPGRLYVLRWRGSYDGVGSLATPSGVPPKGGLLRGIDG